MKLVVHNYWGRDGLESQIRAAYALYQRPGTAGEKSAALEALRRLIKQVPSSALLPEVPAGVREILARGRDTGERFGEPVPLVMSSLRNKE